jgi:DNA (cytosine-5)-methyltransferase 1
MRKPLSKIGHSSNLTLGAVRFARTSTNTIAVPTVAEFFAGIGLMRYGLERAGWKVVFANDIDPQKHSMYDAHFGDASNHFQMGDIHRLAVEQIPTVSLATASFPCTDLSLAGARRGLNTGESSAFWGFIRLLKEMGQRRPRIVLLENVVGFMTSHGGTDFKAALLALNDIGYSVDPFIVDAMWFVPQSRQRLFVVAQRNGKSNNRNLQRPLDESPLRPKALKAFIEEHPEINWRLRALQAPAPSALPLEGILESLSDAAAEWWNDERTQYLLDQMSPKHRDVADRMVKGRAWSYGTVFRRIRNGRSMAELRTDGVAGCLRTPKGGSARQILFKAGRGTRKARLLTPRECARLMGADDFKINVALNQALFGFGDAVCVPVVEWIARNYLNPLLMEMTTQPTREARLTVPTA